MTDHLPFRPVANSVGFLALYVLLSGAMFVGNALMMKDLELPWQGYWALWGTIFSPAAIATVFAAVMNVPDRRRLHQLNTLALVILLAGMEGAFLSDSHLSTALLVVAGLSCGIFIIFLRASGG